MTKQIDITFREGHHRYEFVLLRKNGGYIPVIISYNALENSCGRFRVITFTDISEQLRAKEKLRRANAQLRERQMEIEEDLRLASRVQKSLAPRPMVCAGMSVDSFNHPMHRIGGDFALVVSFENNRLSILVCDVFGHGIGSALIANGVVRDSPGLVLSV